MSREHIFIIVLLILAFVLLWLLVWALHEIKRMHRQKERDDKFYSDPLNLLLKLAIHNSNDLAKGPQGPQGVQGAIHYVEPGVTVLGPEK